ncbi:MAG: DmsE family decaheme c-type cytochrome [Armatimonadetes bacterium]|nr:DmsE family decaheme c-type cytochrome [Armatimonadota bacterium]
MRIPSFLRFLIPLPLAVALAVGLTCSFTTAASAPSTVAAPSTVSEGQKLFFEKSCGACHSIGGKGGSSGPKLDNIGARRDATWLRKKIVDPKFNNPETTMPAVPLQPKELDAIVVFLASLKPPDTPPSSGMMPSSSKPMEGEAVPPSTLPSGSDSPASKSVGGASPAVIARGAEMYRENNCGSCHRLGGKGGTVGPALDDVASRRTDEWLRVQITNPKAHNPKTIMPAYPLPPADLDALIAFLRSPSTGDPPPAPSPSGPATFVGSAACLPCHADLSKEFQRTVHSDALLLAHQIGSQSGCESCHGPGSRHAATGDPKLILNPMKLAPRRNSELCLRCHTGQVSSHDWQTSAHSQAGVSCSSCHQVMKQVVSKLLRKPANELCVTCHRKEAAQFAMVSHHPVPEGRMQCVDCHNPHSGVNEAMLRMPANDQCVSCHAEKQGPFEFEHPAVNGGFTEGCLSCHTPHGSPFKDLRKLAGRGLCIQCHTDKAVGHFDSRPDCSSAGCHTEIHGSHDDPLFFR